MHITFYISASFSRKILIGAWAYSYNVADRDDGIYSHRSGIIDPGYTIRYCNGYVVLKALEEATRLFFDRDFIEERICDIEIRTTVVHTALRIDKEWHNKYVTKNFVRLPPWDKVRLLMLSFHKISSKRMTHTHPQIKLVDSFVAQHINKKEQEQ